MAATTSLTYGVVGPQSNSTGDEKVLRLGKSGDVVTAPYGRYFETAKAGRIYHAMTAVTGVAPGTSIGTTAAFSLYNPTGTGADLVILEASMGYVSGTLGAGTVLWCANTNPAAAAVTGTAITAVPGITTGAAAVGKPLTTATLPASPTVARVFANLGASLASTAVQPWQIVDKVDGALIVAPGTSISLEAVAAAGSSPLVVFSVSWAEVPITS